jgi:hypothetical protein
MLFNSISFLVFFASRHSPTPSSPSSALSAAPGSPCDGVVAFQIYCDFSGYSDIAVDGARVLGYRLISNFDRPYAAVSVADFWRRWHISLSAWFRDYLYVPLGATASRSRAGASTSSSSSSSAA